MRVFIDYQNNVPHRVYIPSEDKVYKVGDSNFIDFLEFIGASQVYLESAPREWIYRLLENNIQVYILRYRNQNSLRRRYSLRKNHSNDAKLLYLIYSENPRYFRRYVRRELDDDQDIKRYILLLREIKRIKQKVKVNDKLGMPTQKLEEYLKELNREREKLLYHLKRRYKGILNLFSDVRGLSGGSLLYFLTLIPEVKSFKSTRSFLRYLGLRNVEVNKLWNREARDLLIKIAMNTALYNNIKFNPRKPDWKYIRKLTLLIYTRLRDSEVNKDMSPF